VSKSTITDIQSIILKQQTLAMSKSIDRMIIDEMQYTPKTYRIEKSWTDRKSGKMYRIAVSGRVLEWLETTQSQYGISNPSWWKFQDQINITNTLFSILILKFGGAE